MAFFSRDGQLMTFIGNTKMILGTLAIVITSLVGAYNVTTTVFLTKLEAKEIYLKHLNQIDSQTSYNKLFILGQKLDRLADKKKLTPEDERRKKDLEKDYDAVSDHIKHLENKHYSNEVKK